MSVLRVTGLPTVIAADTGCLLIVLHTQTGQVRVLAGAARSTWSPPQGSPLAVRVDPAPASWGIDETPACLEPIPATPTRWLPCALLAVLATLAVRHLGQRGRAFARVTALASVATRVGRAATVADAESALRAVRRVARYAPAKVACFEGSTSAAVALAFSGRRVGWGHGIASDPMRMHAWIEVGGQPVGEPPSTSRYTPLIRLP
jgi:Transglutaminase-like superfamily